MILHMLKSDPALRELEYIKVNGPGTAYLFFYDRHRYHGLTWEAAQTVCTHLVDTFLEWIGWLSHFEVLLLPLEEGCCCTAAAWDRQRQCN